jgi:hypothetical protein
MPDGYYCQWMPTKDGVALEWDGVEKFRHHVEWLEYHIQHFLQPWGYVLNGAVRWESIFEPEHGIILVENNHVSVVPEPLAPEHPLS